MEVSTCQAFAGGMFLPNTVTRFDDFEANLRSSARRRRSVLPLSLWGSPRRGGLSRAAARRCSLLVAQAGALCLLGQASNGLRVHAAGEEAERNWAPGHRENVGELIYLSSNSR